MCRNVSVYRRVSTTRAMSDLTRPLWRTRLALFCPFLSMAVASLCPRRGCSMSAGCSSTTAARGKCMRDRTRAHRQSTAMASFAFLFPIASPLLLPLFLLGARTRLLPSRLATLLMAFFLLPTSLPVPLFLAGARTRLLPYRLAALMKAFFLLLTSPPVFLLIFASGDQNLPPSAWVHLSQLLLHPYLVRCHRHFGRIPFPFPPFPLPRCLHHLISSVPPSRLLQFLLPSPLPALTSRITALSSSSPSSSRPVLCHVLFLLTLPVTMCLCVGLSSLFPIRLPPPHTSLDS